jgi:hypothetical protein
VVKAKAVALETCTAEKNAVADELEILKSSYQTIMAALHSAREEYAKLKANTRE